jgi:aspartate 1-decarboxylase
MNLPAREMLRSKLHLATVTRTELRYEGSLAVDSALMEAVDLLPYERIVVINVGSGSRFETYVIPGEAGSGEIAVFGGAARLVAPGDRLIVMAFSVIPEALARDWHPKVVVLDEQNRVRKQIEDGVEKGKAGR